MTEKFEQMLTGGHPNSLGRTIEVVGLVLENHKRLEELFNCYQSNDAVVRLRTSNALKRIEKEQHKWLVPYIDRFIDEIGNLDQASAQWTLADLFHKLKGDMSKQQISKATKLMKHNLKNHEDWIVLNNTMETLSKWAKQDKKLATWIKPHLTRLSKDNRKSVSKRAIKKLSEL